MRRMTPQKVRSAKFRNFKITNFRNRPDWTQRSSLRRASLYVIVAMDSTAVCTLQNAIQLVHKRCACCTVLHKPKLTGSIKTGCLLMNAEEMDQEEGRSPWSKFSHIPPMSVPGKRVKASLCCKCQTQDSSCGYRL